MHLTIEGLVVQGQDDQDKVVVDLEPGQEHVIKLAATGTKWKFGSKSSYTIED